LRAKLSRKLAAWRSRSASTSFFAASSRIAPAWSAASTSARRASCIMSACISWRSAVDAPTELSKTPLLRRVEPSLCVRLRAAPSVSTRSSQFFAIP
jgi:hypothetical protein